MFGLIDQYLFSTLHEGISDPIVVQGAALYVPAIVELFDSFLDFVLGQ